MFEVLHLKQAFNTPYAICQRDTKDNKSRQMSKDRKIKPLTAFLEEIRVNDPSIVKSGLNRVYFASVFPFIVNS